MKLEVIMKRKKMGARMEAGNAIGARVPWQKDALERSQKLGPLSCGGLRGVPRAGSARGWGQG